MRDEEKSNDWLVEEIRRQFKENPKIMTGEAVADFKRCISITAHGGLHKMFVPAMIAVVTPLAFGLIFGRYHLTPGEKVFIYTPSGKQVLGAFTADNNKPWGSLAVQPLAGSNVVIEYRIPAGQTPSGTLTLTRVSIGYRDIFGITTNKDGFFGSSGPCNVDINCSEGDKWQDDKNAVLRIFINNNELCTGVMINNTLNEAVPYVLSAGHGIEDDDDAANTVFLFGYESPYCEGPDGSLTKTISGAELVAHADNLDFTLVKLSHFPPFTYYPYLSGWDASGDTPAPPTVTIHHPQGDVKKISVDNDEPVTASYDVYDANTFWKILQWDVGTTEPGSSGAPATATLTPCPSS